MNKAKKNIVVVGFEKTEQNSISLPYIEKSIVHYVKTIKETIKYQGYLLIINNTKNVSIIDLDKKYRKSFRKFEKVWIYNQNYKWCEDKWSGIEKVNRDIFLDISFSLTEEWEEYKSKKEKENLLLKFNSNKQKKLNELYGYLKKFKTIKTNQIVSDLKINTRSLERYMFDLNNIYHNIGYDYSKNEWYFIW